jgi:hypothetical protein
MKKTLVLSLLFLFTLGMISVAFADPPFELDGNAISNDYPGDDWDVVNNGGGSAIAKTGLIVDRPEPTFAQFLGGGSKDEQDIPNWKHRSGSPPAKDDLTNAYAAAFVNPDDGHFVLIFGMDRYDTSGDAQLGFWFLGDNVFPLADGTFNGVHADGDILVLTNFSGGGDVPTIEVFMWQGSGLVSLGAGSDVLCTDGWIPGGQDHCGITNPVAVTAPWAYENKDVGVTTEFPPAAFFEGAIDLTALGVESCFAQFLAESRSSTSITATLKDFAVPENGFNVCSIDVTKNCVNPRLNEAQDSIIYDISGKVTNDGFGILYDVALSDVPPADGAFQWVECLDSDTVLGTFPLESLAGGGEACYKNTITVPLADNGTSDTVTVTSNTDPDGNGVAVSDTATAECPNLQVSPAIQVTKDCESFIEVVGAQVVAKVTVSGNVCNIGDSNLFNVNVEDLDLSTNPDPLISGITLLVGACESYEGTYVPSVANDFDGNPTTVPGEVVFKDTVEATATDIFGDEVTPHTDMANCPLCE